MSRDVYRSRVYRAERKVFASQPLVSRSHERVAERVGEICAGNQAWRAAAGERKNREVLVGFTNGSFSYAESHAWRVTVAGSHVCQDWVLLHELAHLPVSNAFPAHGREFCETYIAVVRAEYGDEIATQLKHQLVEAGCPVERDEAYVAYLRRNLSTVARNRSNYKDVFIITRAGSYHWCEAGMIFDQDLLLPKGMPAQREGQPAAVVGFALDDIAYLTAIKKGKWDR
jgi:hypothetical protein